MASTPLRRSPFDAAAIGLDPMTTLALVLLASWALPAGPLTALLGVILVAYLLMSPAVANGAALRLALPFVVMAAWGVAMSGGNEHYIVVKDLWYAGKLCLCLMLGFLIGIRRVEDRRVMRMLVWLATVKSVFTILQWLRHGAGIGDLEEDTTRVPLVALAAIVPLLDQARRETGVRRLSATGLLLLIAFAVLVSSSRITLLAALAMALSWAGLFSRTRRAIFGGIIVGIAIGLLWQFLPEYNGGELTVAIKLRRSLDEVLLTDNLDPSQILLNWRGFEAYNAQLLFDSGSALRKLFGFGLGATVDLGQEIRLDEGVIRFLPILHNGYYYILVKYGLVGILVYLVTVVRFGLLGKVASDNLTVEDRMLRGAIIAILLATGVITGLYNKTELHGLALLVAWLIGHAQRRLRDEAASILIHRPT